MTAQQSRPLITANQVTLLRLLPIPILAWCFYGTTNLYWFGLILGTFIGSTDWVDGMLARKQGPTVLGALLDPMADKVFIAMVYLPMAHIELVPTWPVVLLFVREFLITGLRTAYKDRNIQFKTSYLAKVKTWVQMQAVAMILLVHLVDGMLLSKIFVAAGIVAAIVALAFGLVRRKTYVGAWIMVGFMLLLALMVFKFDKVTCSHLMMYFVTALTWISGMDYIIGGIPKLLKFGRLRRLDTVRILGSLAIPIALGFCIARSEINAWPIFLIAALELSVGGIDNLCAHHHDASPAGPWALRVLGVASLLLVSLAFNGNTAAQITWIATIISLIGVTTECWRAKKYILPS